MSGEPLTLARLDEIIAELNSLPPAKLFIVPDGPPVRSFRCDNCGADVFIMSAGAFNALETLADDFNQSTRKDH